jgi:hypothetical protein
MINLEKNQEKVESRVRSFWDIDDLSQIHLQLSEAQDQWVKSTGEVVAVSTTNKVQGRFGVLLPLSLN